jgi:hypothetical protein
MGSCRNLGRSCSSSSHCDDCRCITGLSSCARQLFVCWTGGGNQSPPLQTIGPFPSSFSPYGVCIIREVHTTTRWGDWMLFIPDQCRIQHDDNDDDDDDDSFGVSSAALAARSSHVSDPVQHESPSCLLRCTPRTPTCPPSKAETCPLCEHGWIPIINMTTNGGHVGYSPARCTDLSKCKKLCPFAFDNFFPSPPNK